MQKISNLSAAIALMAASQFSWSQATIVESQPMGGRSPGAQPAQPASPAGGGMDLSQFYYQLQMLQQEVQQLRGIVDEQANEIRRLKQRQLDDYVDLDRRLSQISQSPGGASVVTPVAGAAAAASAVSSVSPATQMNAESELAAYDKAVRLIIKEKKLDEGAQAMQSYISAYPQGVYVGNAQYWLGQVYFVQGDLPGAKKWFSALLSSHPNSQKAPEAKYKLAEVLHKMGDDQQAKSLLNEVVQSNSSVSRLAQDYLNNNF